MLGKLASFMVLLFVLLATSAQAQSATASGTVIDLAVEYMATSAVFRLSNTPAGCPLVAGAYWLQFSPSSTDEVKGCVRGPACGRIERTLRTPRSQRNDAIGYVQRHWIHAQ